MQNIMHLTFINYLLAVKARIRPYLRNKETITRQIISFFSAAAATAATTTTRIEAFVYRLAQRIKEKEITTNIRGNSSTFATHAYIFTSLEIGRFLKADVTFIFLFIKKTKQEKSIIIPLTHMLI